ncbi:MAG: hypothetical protein JXR65_04520 [Bacteroidales bacterium]|nr:hypothetical protein [Bacteroidales bacterium]
MKRLITSLILLIFIGLIFSGCKIDNDPVDETLQNYLSYQGRIYELSQCFYLKIGSAVNQNQDTVYYSGLLFLSPGIDVTIKDDTLIDATGKGAGLSAGMLSSENSDSFIPGRYVTESGTATVDMPGTINSCNAFFDYDGNTEQGTFLDINNGEAVLSGTKDEMIAEILLADDYGNIIKGYYMGNVVSVVMELDKKGKIVQNNKVLK